MLVYNARKRKRKRKKKVSLVLLHGVKKKERLGRCGKHPFLLKRLRRVQ